jgi:aminopeptidase N
MPAAPMLALLAVATASAPAWRLDRLDLAVSVEPERERLRIEGTMEVACEADTDALTLALNTRQRNLRFERATAAGVTARIALLGDGPTEQALFRLPRRHARGERIAVSFALRSAGESTQFQMGPEGFYASWVEGWYPTPAEANGEPGEPAARGSTTFRLPRGWRSVSNGTVGRARQEKGRTVERWTVDTAAARSFVAAPFLPAKTVDAGGRSIAFHLLRPRGTSDAQAAALAGALRAMEARFGPYPYATYHVVEVPPGKGFAAGSEQGFIMVRPYVLDDTRGSLPLFAHEAAHGWWGNLVRSDGPGAMMLSEALAQYGAVIAIEELEGKPAMDEFLRFSRPGYHPLQCALGYFDIWREGGDAPLAALADGPSHHNLSDSKGMWFHHMLRLRMGDDAFFGLLRRVVEERSAQELTLDAFRRRLLATDPTLEPFLRQWLDRTGAPVLRTDWWSIDRGQAVEIAIEQVQAGDPFEVPLEVAIATAGGATVRETLALAQRTQRFRVELPARALGVTFDSDHRLLFWRPEYGPRP